MAQLVLVLGNSGTGKSTSLRNFKKDEAMIINVCGKGLPFKNDLQVWNTSNCAAIAASLPGIDANAIVIDDFNYIFQFENMSRVAEGGYQKYNEMAKHFYDVITAARTLSPAKIVYILAHTKTEGDGYIHLKTVGKLVDNQITPEGLCSVVLESTKDESGYHFVTNTTLAGHPAKSPIGMFESEVIDNDLKAVDTIIREYYGLEKLQGGRSSMIKAPATKKAE